VVYWEESVSSASEVYVSPPSSPYLRYDQRSCYSGFAPDERGGGGRVRRASAAVSVQPDMAPPDPNETLPHGISRQQAFMAMWQDWTPHWPEDGETIRPRREIGQDPDWDAYIWRKVPPAFGEVPSSPGRYADVSYVMTLVEAAGQGCSDPDYFQPTKDIDTAKSQNITSGPRDYDEAWADCGAMAGALVMERWRQMRWLPLDDLFQVARIAVWRSLASSRRTASFKTFARVAVQNALRNAARDLYRGAFPAAPREDTAVAAEDPFACKEIFATVLADRDGRFVIGRLAGMTLEEMDCHPQRYARALRRLRPLMRDIDP
jgi:hypothetical protein